MRSLLRLAIVLALVGSACGDDTVATTPTPTPTSPVTEIFSSGLLPLGTAARTFVAAQAGSVAITLTSSGPPGGVSLSVGIGIPTPTASGGCSLTSAVVAAPAVSGPAQLTATVDAGTYCLKVFDTGTLTAQTFFSTTIVRP